MKINNITPTGQNFGARMTKNVQRGFDNLGYRIKRDYSENSDAYRIYETHYNNIKNADDRLIIDSIFDCSDKSKINRNRDYVQFPYCFVVTNDYFGYVNPYCESKCEEGLYTLGNLEYLDEIVELNKDRKL